MSDMIEVVFDSDDEYIYPKIGESDEEYEARMEVLRKKRDARMTEDEKLLVAETLKAFSEAQPVTSI